MKKKKIQKKKSHKSPTQKNKRLLGRGKAGFGVLAVLAVIGALSIALVFGLQQLSPYEPQLVGSYLCCDSGSGELCRPNTAVNLNVKVKNVDTNYQLLKTGVKFEEGFRHLEPVLQPGYVNPVLPTGQYVYLNIVSENPDAQLAYVRPLGGPHMCASRASNEERQNPMDTIFGPNLQNGCEAIPDDELIYVCTKGCEANPLNGDNGIYDVYFRANDLANHGIPDAIKNCAVPEETEASTSGQRIISLPSPSDKPNLQLETFYVENDAIVASWVSPYCKPAVYLYPQKESDIHVRVEPLGKMLITIPTYPKDGWKVKAYPNGDIFHEGLRFDYLFYEASIPDELIILPKEGYVVSYDSLSIFIPDLVSKLGLNEKETRQFTEYWVKVLPKSPYYQIKIVEQSVLGKISPLYIIPSPQTSIRVTLHFTPLEAEAELPEPNLVTPERKGFTVSEWGGIFKRDAAHPFSCFM